jgi:Protein of unknown function (DUF1566)
MEVVDTQDLVLNDQQYEEMKLGLSALWGMAFKYRACLERLLSFNREINAYLSMEYWDKWIDFPALVAQFEPNLQAASVFLKELDAVVARNHILQVDLATYGQQLTLEMKSSTVKPLIAKFHKMAQTTQKQVEAEDAERVLAQIKAEDAQHHREHVTQAGYVENGDGTVTDVKTQLMWLQCAEGQEGPDCAGQVLQYTWDLAMRIPTNLNQHGGFAGYQDWRLPTLDELQSLIRTDETPTICSEAFPRAPGELFWSSTLEKENGREARNVYFGSGSLGSNDRDNTFAVRLVRSA